MEGMPDSSRFIRGGGNLGFYIQESIFAGTGHVVIDGTAHNGNETVVSGHIVVDKVIFPEAWKPPLSVTFRRGFSATGYFANKNEWGFTTTAEMDGMKVIVFASGKVDALQMTDVIRADNLEPGFEGDLAGILNKTAAAKPELTPELLKDHPLLATYEYRNAFSDAVERKTSIDVAERFFGSGSELLREFAFDKIVDSLPDYAKKEPAMSSKLLHLALADLQKSDGKSLGNKLSYLDSGVLDAILKSKDWSAATLAVVTGRRNDIPKDSHDRKLANELITELKARKREEI